MREALVSRKRIGHAQNLAEASPKGIPPRALENGLATRKHARAIATTLPYVAAMKITTIVGTSRPGNFTIPALSVTESELSANGVEVSRFDPAGKHLPFPGDGGSHPDADELRRLVSSADGIVIATPEYHGSMPAMLKLIIENMGFPSAMNGKPVALLGVAAGRIGAIKTLEQVRSVCSHTGAIVLPAPISLAGINRLVDSQGLITDEATQKALKSVAHSLLGYLKSNVCPRMTLEAMLRGESA